MRMLPAARGARMQRAHPGPLALTLAACLALLVAVPLARSRFFPGPSDEVLVRFELVAPGARSVALAGDFNGWQPGLMTPKGPDSGGTWETTVRLRRDSVYTYNFVVDGERWVVDPRSQERVEDGFGGLNSILKL